MSPFDSNCMVLSGTQHRGVFVVPISYLIKLENLQFFRLLGEWVSSFDSNCSTRLLTNKKTCYSYIFTYIYEYVVTTLWKISPLTFSAWLLTFFLIFMYMYAYICEYIETSFGEIEQLIKDDCFLNGIFFFNVYTYICMNTLRHLLGNSSSQSGIILWSSWFMYIVWSSWFIHILD